jgi:hypothetical protein
VKKITKIDNIYIGKDTFVWKHLAFSWNAENKKLITYVNCSITGNTIIRELPFSEDTSPISSAKNYILVKFGFDDEDTLTQQNVSFSIFGLMFNENLSINEKIESFRINDPRECYLCKGKCIYGICDSSFREQNSITIGDIYTASEITSVEDIEKESSKLFLFRQLINDKKYHVQSFSRYVFSLQIDVDSYLSSKYNVNKNILLCITNDNKDLYEEMKLSDLIPSNTYRFGVLSIVYEKGHLILYRGYLPWTGSVNGLEIPLGGKTLKEYSRINIILQFTREISRILVSADDVIFAQDIESTYNSESINPKSLVYTHPSIYNVKLNLFNPSIDVEYRQDESHYIPKERNYCKKIDPNCNMCINMDNSITPYCISCLPGFNYFREECYPLLNQLPSQ